MGTAENPHAGQGMVVLDIGGDIGALIVTAPASMEGVEIEIAPQGRRNETPDEGGSWWSGDWHSEQYHSHPHGEDGHRHAHAAAWPHVAVVGRPQADGVVYAAVYPSLRAGQYELWRVASTAGAISVHVMGGQVSEIEWTLAQPDTEATAAGRAG